MKNVIIAAITITRPSQKKFKLKENDLPVVLANPEKYDLNNLTCKVEFHQEREVSASNSVSASGRRSSALSINEVMKGHDKVSGPRTKKAWHNSVNVAYLMAKGYAIGKSVGDCEGKLAYLLTEEYLTPETRDGRITSNPKRKGKGGAFILSVDGKLIFQATSLQFNGVPDSGVNEFEEYQYQDFVKFEQAAAIKPGTEVIEPAGIPDDSTVDGFFTAEYEAWLTNEYTNRNQKVLKQVA